MILELLMVFSVVKFMKFEFSYEDYEFLINRLKKEIDYLQSTIKNNKKEIDYFKNTIRNNKKLYNELSNFPNNDIFYLERLDTEMCENLKKTCQANELLGKLILLQSGKNEAYKIELYEITGKELDLLYRVSEYEFCTQSRISIARLHALNWIKQADEMQKKESLKACQNSE